MLTMRPSLLKTFLAVADARNVTRAAAEVHLAQSSVSDQILQLETELGTALFARSRTGLELTAAGKTLRPYAQEILSLMQEAGAAVAASAEQGTGSVRIGALETIASTTLPKWLTAFRSALPGIDVKLRITGSAGLFQLLRGGDIDVAFCFERDNLDGRWMKRVVTQELLILVASPAQGLALSGQDLATLARQRFVATSVGCVYRSLLDEALDEAGISAPQIAIEVDSIRALARLVGAGAGLALLPRLAVSDELSRGELVALPWPGAVRSVSLVAISRRQRVQSPALRQLFAYVSMAAMQVRPTDGLLQHAI
jgi:DNA-binding transcriptional LysR family regulator